MTLPHAGRGKSVMSRFDLDGKLAVITGAGSGIGAALAQSLAGRGAHLALADVNEAGLQATRDSIARNQRISLHPMDVRDADAVAGLPGAVQAAHGAPADILVNNAGVALEGAFSKVSADDFDWLLDINLHAPIRLTRAFLPMLTARPQAQIVNLSSAFGLIAPPGQSAYCTAKFGLRGFTEALRHELISTGVGVTQVHPGGINTDIARNARMTSELSEADADAREKRVQAFLKMPPHKAGEIIAKGIEARKKRILVGNDAWAMDIIQRLLPVGYWSILKKQFGA